MTVSTTAFVTTLAGNGATTVFNFSFIADNATTIQVIYTDANGVQTVLSPGAYTLFINPVAVGNLWGIGGTVTYPLSGSPIATGTSLTIQRIVPYLQNISISNQGAFYPQAVEQALDILEFQIQQFQGALTNVVKAPVVDGSIDMTLPALAARANKFLLFNSAGQPTVSLGIPSTTPIGAGSIMFFLSGFASLALADAAASAVGGSLVIDQNVSLSGNTTLTTKEIIFAGGVMTRGANNLTVNNIIAGDLAIFDKAGAGTVTITHGPVNVAWFGVSRDGVTDDTAAINRALASNSNIILTAGDYYYTGTLTTSIAGTNILGAGVNAILHPAVSTGRFNIAHSNCTIKDLQVKGNGIGFAIGSGGSVSQTHILNVYFASNPAGNLSPGVSLYTCDNVWVDKCTFFQVTYGVLQQTAFVCSAIKITDCTASDMYADMWNFNGTTGTGGDILIENNTYMGSHSYPTPKIEERFGALVNSANVRIMNNYVQNCAGDSAIHAEYPNGNRLIITGNLFVDCGVGAGNSGYLYILNSAKNCIISSNYFERSDANAGSKFIDLSSGGYSNEMIITENRFKDDTGHIAYAVDLTGHIGQTIISDNYCFGCDTFVKLGGTSAVQILGNTIESVTNGVYAVAAGNSNVSVVGNNFSCSTWSIHIPGPTRFHVATNMFLTGDVLGTGGTDCFMTGNMFGAGLVNFTMASAGPTRCVEIGLNFKIGTGAV